MIDFAKRSEELKIACINKVENHITPAVQSSVENILGRNKKWDITYEYYSATTSPVILFSYPTDEESHISSYIPPKIKVEIGSRPDQQPADITDIKPWVAEDFPETFSIPACRVNALDIERTFWEKATILHAEFHKPSDKQMRSRLSRDYYDVVTMYNHEKGKAAIKNMELLERVVDFKKMFFRSGWANYDSAKAGTFHLHPPAGRIDDLKKDYKAMEPMFYETPPKFDEILERLNKMEDELNKPLFIKAD